MPVASSSRSRARPRAEDSSDIEEERPTQRSRDDVDDDNEDPQPRSSAKRNKKGKGRSAGTNKSGKQREEGEELDSDDGIIDVNNFEDQPFSRVDLQRLKGLSSDWVNMAQNINKNHGMISDIATAVADNAEGDEAVKGITELDAIAKDLIDISAKIHAHEKSLETIYQKVGQGEEITDSVERYRAGVLKLVSEYEKKTTRQKYAKNEQYIALRQAIHEVHHPGEAMPPLTESIPKEDGDASDDDDDLEVGGISQDYKCPLTLTPLQDPWTSNICGHSFSGEAIKQFFKGARGPKKCPASGCTRSFTLANCQPDKELGKKVKAAARRARRREEDDDGDEVVE